MKIKQSKCVFAALRKMSLAATAVAATAAVTELQSGCSQSTFHCLLHSMNTAAAALSSSTVRQQQWGASLLQHFSSAAAAAAFSGAAGAPCPQRAPPEDQVSPGRRSSSGTPASSPRLQHTAALGILAPAPDGYCTSETVGGFGGILKVSMWDNDGKPREDKEYGCLCWWKIDQITLKQKQWQLIWECCSLAGHFTSCGLAIDRQATEELSAPVPLPSPSLLSKQAAAQHSSRRSPLSTGALWRRREYLLSPWKCTLSPVYKHKTPK